MIATLIFFPTTGWTDGNNEIVEPAGEGSINWSSGIVRAVGIGAPPEWSYGKPQARPMALTAARMVAYRNLMEVVQGVQIESSTKVENFMLTDDTIRAQVDGMIRGAQVVKKEYMSDGTVEVTVEMNLHGGFAQLVLPQDIQQVESIKTNPPATTRTVSTRPKGYTGLVVDARGLGAKPAMAPKVLDENGQEVYGSAYVSREYAVQQGMAGYSKNIESACQHPRVTSNPLIVKGLRTEGPGHSDIVISAADAAKLRSASGNLSFLKKCRVMFVVD